MIRVTYDYPTATGEKERQTYICVTDTQAEHICKMVENRKEHGYKLIDFTRE